MGTYLLFLTETNMADRRLSSSGMDADKWIPQQTKAFTTWVNSRLAERSLTLDRELYTAFDDGLYLIPFVEILTGGKALKHVENPKMRIQKSENVNLAFNLLEEADFHPDIHVEEVLDGVSKMILGFIWQLFLKFGSDDNTATKARGTLNDVFDAAEAKLGVPKLLDADDVAGFGPDDKATKMYVTLLKNAWAEKEDELMAAERAEA